MSKKKNPKTPKERKKRGIVKKSQLIIIGGVILAIAATVQAAYQSARPSHGDMPYTEFWERVQEGEIESARVVYSLDTFTAYSKDGDTYKVVNPRYDEFKKDLLEAGVELKISDRDIGGAVRFALTNAPLMIILFLVVMYLFKQAGKTSDAIFKVFNKENAITFDDVKGLTETKSEIQFAVEQIRNRRKLLELGARPVNGILLSGPPGTGKTMLAKAIAGEAEVPFISVAGSDFIEVFVGRGAARVRALWELATSNAPCVIFIDEIDAIGKKRAEVGRGTSEDNHTLNALLQKMDGLDARRGVLVVGATNRVEDLDPALTRPGRFDRKIYVGAPSSKSDRDEIVEHYIKSKKLADDVTLEKASKIMFGMSGAEIENTLNEAVMESLMSGREGVISLGDIDISAMKLRANGVVKDGSSKEDREIASVHEAGHAIVSLALGQPVSKVSITAFSSGVGGMTIRDTDAMENRKMFTREEMLNNIRICLGGMCAERLIFGEHSIGCGDDLGRASETAYGMVANYAMDSDNLFSNVRIKHAVLDSGYEDKNIERANNLLKKCETDVIKTLEENMSRVKRLSETLLAVENIHGLDSLSEVDEEWEMYCSKN